ncbi:MAG: hypothetical protein KDC87_03650, partial [Planctomycetes bacterium]|nr:hypothetical protein [Planctomycetota bacterium]
VATQLHIEPSSTDPGTEVFSVSGARNDIRLVADYLEGPSSSTPDDFVRLPGSVYYSAEIEFDQSRGLFRYDTATGAITRETYSGPSLSREFRALARTATTLFYLGGDAKNELHTNNTGKLMDYVVTDAGAAPAGSRLVFARQDFSGSGVEPWVSDGTSTGTVRLLDIVPGAGSSNPRGFVALGSNVYFLATSAQGEELWVTDGTPTGTRQVADIAAGAASSNIGPLQVFGSALFFRADDGISGEELWRATATGAARVADVETGAGSSSPDELTVYGGRVYFAATQGGDLTNGLRVTVGR